MGNPGLHDPDHVPAPGRALIWEELGQGLSKSSTHCRGPVYRFRTSRGTRNLLRRLPEGASSYADDIDSIFYLIYYIVGAWFILVLGVLIYFLIRYRRREGRRAADVPSNTWKQAAWILIPAAVVLVMDL
jgi:hypothetical protein